MNDFVFILRFELIILRLGAIIIPLQVTSRSLFYGEHYSTLYLPW